MTPPASTPSPAASLDQRASDIPSVINHGLELSGDALVVATMLFRIIVQPSIASAALAAAWLNRYLTAATIAVMLPTIIDAAGFAAFAISVFRYGF